MRRGATEKQTSWHKQLGVRRQTMGRPALGSVGCQQTMGRPALGSVGCRQTMGRPALSSVVAFLSAQRVGAASVSRDARVVADLECFEYRVPIHRKQLSDT